MNNSSTPDDGMWLPEWQGGIKNGHIRHPSYGGTEERKKRKKKKTSEEDSAFPFSLGSRDPT